MSFNEVNLSDVKAAKSRISQYLKETPVFQCKTLDDKYGRKFYFKAENMQATGSFKVRGALNATLCALEREPNIQGLIFVGMAANDVKALPLLHEWYDLVLSDNRAITHSSGNHGRSLAWTSRILGLKCVVVCPTTVPDCKLADITQLGAEVVVCDPSPVLRLQTTEKIAREKNLKYISTCDDYDVIAGQGTICLEFLQQIPELDAILIPASGGGMAAGSCISAKAIKPDVKVFIVEPEGKDLERSLRAGIRLWPNPPRTLDTVADGMRMQQLQQKTWPIILQYAEKSVITVSDSDIVDGMKFAFKEMKLVIEPSAGSAVAAAMSETLRNMDTSLKHVGVILCGGNADIDNLPWTKQYVK